MAVYKFKRVTKENELNMQTLYDDRVEAGYILVAPFGTSERQMPYELLSEALFKLEFTPTGKVLENGFFEAEENE